MSKPIEDYAMLGDRRSAALVARDGSIDWLCWPRFDSASCFAALLGAREHGCWRLNPKGRFKSTRRYRDHTLILETEFETDEGRVRVIDCMPTCPGLPASLIRRVEGLEGTVTMKLSLTLRFDYGLTIPWVTRSSDDEWCAVAGPDRVVLRSDVEIKGENMHSVAEFKVKKGKRFDFALSHGHSFADPPKRFKIGKAIKDTEKEWSAWANCCADAGRYTDAVRRSLSVLRGLSYQPTGGIVAAVTTSLPEKLGGTRNWDYRFCWVRDATLTLTALMNAGYFEEARAWREWLLRAIAGAPEQLQIMYGVAGERLLPEREVPWLPGYADSRPVRVGNAAHEQRQLDIYGELAFAMTRAMEELGELPAQYGFELRLGILRDLEKKWREPDEGIWEIRGESQHFVHSKAMAWLAFRRAADTEAFDDASGDSKHWAALADEIHADICKRGYNAEIGSFTQVYGGEALDASLLTLAVVGFLPPDDPRIAGTVAAVEKRLLREGFVARYETQSGVDGLPPGEGEFLACSFWLVDNYVLLGRLKEARALFERLLGLANDVGLMAEEYDSKSRRQLGNFPQAFSHVALVNSAFALIRAEAGRKPPKRAG